MELTQERLDEIDIVGERGFYHHTGTGLSAPQARVKSIIEAATGEKVTIVEPEPEIPEAAIRAAIEALSAGGYHHISRALTVEVLQSAYKAERRGLRK